MADRDLRRVANRGQVDRRVPGEQEPDVVVDDAAGGGRNCNAQLVETGRERGVVLVGERWKVRNARRERITRTVQALLLSVVPRAVRAPLPASFVALRI
jgi:DNA-binding LacI/PurR family transcriptional regulator